VTLHTRLALPYALKHTRAALALLVALSACTPKIGNECSVSFDCSTLGDRLCDTTLPGGYCTQFGCQPDGCPSEAACIVFRSKLDPACGTSADGKNGRFSQTFCMLTCDEAGDCREGYACEAPASRDAQLLDAKKENPAALKICVPTATPVPPPDEAPGICFPGTAPPLLPTTASASGSSSATGSGGAGGSSSTVGSGGAG
jgi:hypothetical protein